MDLHRIYEGFNPLPDGESPVRHRTGIVDVVNADGTVDLDLGGTIVPSVSVLEGASVAAGSVVQVIAWAGDLLVLGVVSSNASLPAQAVETTDQTAITSTTFVPGSPACGLAFVAPASGDVWVSYYGFLEVNPSAASQRRIELGWEMREGSVVGSGTVVVAALTIDRIIALATSVSGNAAQGSFGDTHLVSGVLTPGANYNVQTMHRVNNGTTITAAVLSRRIAVDAA